jgi:uroporphyrinogen decarboxylase
MSGIFRRAIAGEVLPTPPIWMMRQAGRYHSHYQRLRKQHSFDQLCRTPELAADVAMGPIEDFDFDAAIVFSDLLYPLDALGLTVSYDDGPPKFARLLTKDTIQALAPVERALPALAFQWEAVACTRARLAPEKGLLGFVGGPWTMFVYAMCGSHAGSLEAATSQPDLYRAFADRMTPLLAGVIERQLAAGADVVMLFDTSAGAVPRNHVGCDSSAVITPDVISADLVHLAGAFPRKLGYYAKGVTRAQLGAELLAAPWAGIGVDHTWPLADTLRHRPVRGFIQGNFDQTQLTRPTDGFRRALDAYLTPLRALTADERRGWICGLGHGVLPSTPEEHVRTFVRTLRETFR